MSHDQLPDPEHQKSDKYLDEVYRKERALAHLRNSVLEPGEGLITGIRNFVSTVSGLTSLDISLNDHGSVKHLNSMYEITVFRIAQELIANIIKHADATTVTIDIACHRESIHLSVIDNGTGFNSSEKLPGMGLYSIKKRVTHLEGRIQITSGAQAGTTVLIEIPVHL